MVKTSYDYPKVINAVYTVWKIKLGKSLEKSCSLCLSLYDSDTVESFVKELEQLLDIEPSEVLLEFEDKNTFKKIAESFLYLASYPKSLKPWFLFYEDLFKKSPDVILLTLNRIMKARNDPDKQSLKQIAQNLFKRFASTLGLQYKDFRNINLKSKSEGDYFYFLLIHYIA